MEPRSDAHASEHTDHGGRSLGMDECTIRRGHTARRGGGVLPCHRDAHIEVIPFSADLVDAAMQLYGTRHDKNWSLTDCFSFVVMEQRRLVQALTADNHFRQAGFEAVLLNEPPE